MRTKDCAYYVFNEIPGYDANTLYFFGYENPDLEGKNQVV